MCLRILGHCKDQPKENVTFLVGEPGIWALLTALGNRLGKHVEVEEACREILSWVKDVSRLDPDICEQLYGRAGYLHCIYFVREKLQRPEFGGAEARKIIVEILQTGLANAARPEYKPLPLGFAWHGSIYLGAAHGVVGILHELLNFVGEFELIEAENPCLTATIEARTGARHISTLLVQSIDSLCCRPCITARGNLRSSLRSSADRLVHWCHGAPGLVMLLCKAAAVFRPRAPLYLMHARDLADVVWRRGLLRKGVGLCHGIAGNGYCFLAMHKATGDRQWARRAMRFAEFGRANLDTLRDVPDRPDSLYEGTAGFAVFAVAVGAPESHKMPGFE
eukprot:Polyplicarium_translucidae@DN3087_c0_g1_i12.p1